MTEIKIAYSFKNLRNGWSRVTSGVMTIGTIYGHTRLCMKESWKSPRIVLSEVRVDGDFTLDIPFRLTKGQYFRWERI